MEQAAQTANMATELKSFRGFSMASRRCGANFVMVHHNSESANSRTRYFLMFQAVTPVGMADKVDGFVNYRLPRSDSR